MESCMSVFQATCKPGNRTQRRTTSTEIPMDSTHPRSRRHIVQGLAMLVAPTVAVACATGTPTAPTTTKAVAIAPSRPVNGFEFWQPWPIDQPTHGGPIGWKQLSEAFNSTTTNKVQVSTPAGDYIAAVQAAISAGTPPDGWQADQQWMVVYAAKGASAPLDDLIKRDKWDKASIFPSAYETMTWNGRVWGMMQHPDIVFMWYATGLLKETGADPAKLPMTWQDLDVVAQKATRKQGDGFDFVGFTPHLGTDWQVILAQSNGAKLVSDDGKIVQFDTPEVVEAIEWVKGHVTRLGGMGTIGNWQKLVPGGDGQASGTATAGADIFAQKRMAAVVGGNWTADNIRRANRRLSQTLEFAVGPVPSGPQGSKDVKSNVYSGGILEVARKGGPKIGQVWEFMKFTATKEGGLNVQRNTADVSASREAARDPSILGNPDTGLGRKEFYTLFDTGIGSRTIKHPATIELTAEFSRPIWTSLSDQTTNTRDALKEASRVAQAKVDAVLATLPKA